MKKAARGQLFSSDDEANVAICTWRTTKRLVSGLYGGISTRDQFNFPRLFIDLSVSDLRALQEICVSIRIW